MYVDYDYYINEFYGELLPKEEFKQLEKRAADIVDQITYYRIPHKGFENFPSFVQGQIKKAVSAQLEYIYVNGGLEFIADSGQVASMQIGKFSIGSKNQNSEDNAVSGSLLAPTVTGYLLPTGLLYGGVGVC